MHAYTYMYIQPVAWVIAEMMKFKSPRFCWWWSKFMWLCNLYTKPCCLWPKENIHFVIIQLEILESLAGHLVPVYRAACQSQTSKQKRINESELKENPKDQHVGNESPKKSVISQLVNFLKLFRCRFTVWSWPELSTQESHRLYEPYIYQQGTAAAGSRASAVTSSAQLHHLSSTSDIVIFTPRLMRHPTTTDSRSGFLGK